MLNQLMLDDIKKYKAIIINLQNYLTNSQLEEQLAALENKVNEDTLWNNPDEAKKALQEKSNIEKTLEDYKKAIKNFNAGVEFAEILDENSSIEEVTECEDYLNSCFKALDKIETTRLLAGKADKNNAFIEINSGAGGTESQDWANMLLRMYSRWAEAEGFKAEIVEFNNGEEAGIKSATLHIKGEYAYGLIKTEIGVHRLVRISPFDSNARRHTSFASVFAYPEVNDDIEIDIRSEDLKIDTFRASGAGGQHVNTTDSAIRITHIPTKTVVQCQNQRSQHKNKDEALKMLKAKLYELELKKQEAEKISIEAGKSDNSWGHQIRSYVMQPYKLVKDLRTNVETSNVEKVLNGDINGFIQAELNRK